jgi:hypothetical protein
VPLLELAVPLLPLELAVLPPAPPVLPLELAVLEAPPVPTAMFPMHPATMSSNVGKPDRRSLAMATSVRWSAATFSAPSTSRSHALGVYEAAAPDSTSGRMELPCGVTWQDSLRPKARMAWLAQFTPKLLELYQYHLRPFPFEPRGRRRLAQAGPTPHRGPRKLASS